MNKELREKVVFWSLVVGLYIACFIYLMHIGNGLIWLTLILALVLWWIVVGILYWLTLFPWISVAVVFIIVIRALLSLI